LQETTVCKTESKVIENILEIFNQNTCLKPENPNLTKIHQNLQHQIVLNKKININRNFKTDHSNENPSVHNNSKNNNSELFSHKKCFKDVNTDPNMHVIDHNQDIDPNYFISDTIVKEGK
jgi:tetrahydrodipicolinate N-succinyltransferase